MEINLQEEFNKIFLGKKINVVVINKSNQNYVEAFIREHFERWRDTIEEDTFINTENYYVGTINKVELSGFYQFDYSLYIFIPELGREFVVSNAAINFECW